MGTRCLTVFQDENLNEIVVMYRQFDGYLAGHGADLKELLWRKHLCNGFSAADKADGCNGMTCLAAQVVAHFKKGIGNFYLHPAGKRDCGEEFVYTLYPKDGVIWLRVDEGCVTFFGCSGTAQKDMAALYNGPIKEFDPAKCEELEH